MACDSSASLSSSEDAFSWSNPRGFESPRYQRSIISFLPLYASRACVGVLGWLWDFFWGPLRKSTTQEHEHQRLDIGQSDESGCEKNKEKMALVEYA
jgi:hypothetical protein